MKGEDNKGHIILTVKEIIFNISGRGRGGGEEDMGITAVP